MSPDGTRAVVIGNFVAVGGQSRVQIVLIDLTTSPASVANWSTQGYAAECAINSFWTDSDEETIQGPARLETTGDPKRPSHS